MEKTKVIITEHGTIVKGSTEALYLNYMKYPTYDLIAKRHEEVFKVKERMNKLNM